MGEAAGSHAKNEYITNTGMCGNDGRLLMLAYVATMKGC